MKHIKDLIFEVKLNKISKDRRFVFRDQFKNSVIHVVDKLPEQEDIKAEDIIGKVIQLSLLNNKSILRIQFNNMQSIYNGELAIKQLPKGGFVIVTM